MSAFPLSQIGFRPYEPEDLLHLQRITIEAFEGVSIDQNIERRFGSIGGHDWKWRKARAIEEDLRREEAMVLVAVNETQPVGYVTTWIDREAALGYIPNIAVTASLRGRGIGRQLLERALEHFRQAGVRHVRIETLDQNSIGQHLYPAVGFREVARQIHYCLELEG